jgi:hypothetical protein
MGFIVTGRSPSDDQSFPYPLIHLQRERACIFSAAARSAASSRR